MYWSEIDGGLRRSNISFSMSWLWLRSDDEAASALDSLCRADLSVGDFFKNDLGRWTPCFVDLAVLGVPTIIVGGGDPWMMPDLDNSLPLRSRPCYRHSVLHLPPEAHVERAVHML